MGGNVTNVCDIALHCDRIHKRPIAPHAQQPQDVAQSERESLMMIYHPPLLCLRPAVSIYVPEDPA